MLINNSSFLVKTENLNPLSLEYIDWWREQKRRCIDGYWVGGKYMPGPLYFYVNFWVIKLKRSKGKGEFIGSPLLRDLEWEKAYILLEARGFSGFINDKKHTCDQLYSHEVRKVNEELGLIQKSDLKYVNARDYLRDTHSSDMGIPLFRNQAKNVIDIEVRGSGKSYNSAGTVIAWNFLFDGAVSYDEYVDGINSGELLSSETLVGAVDAKYSKDLLSKVQLGLDNLKGSQEFNGQFIQSPLAKTFQGSFHPSKYVEAVRSVKVGGSWKTVGSRSKIHHRTFADNPFAGNGTRPGISTFEEVGFWYNLESTLGAMKETTADGADKFGTIWMMGCVCNGTKVYKRDGKVCNIEDIKQDDGIIGYNGDAALAQKINWLKPPTKKECCRVSLNDGSYIECSHDHPILIRKDRHDNYCSFIKAINIKKNYQIIKADNISIFGDEKYSDAYMIGLMIGDGYYPKTSNFSISIDSEEVYNYITHKYETTIRKSWDTKDWKYYDLYIKDRKLKKLFEELGIRGQSKDKKRLPENIHKFNKNSLSQLIAGYFDADGNITAPSSKNGRIVLTSVVFELLEGVKYQLLKFGIHCSIYKENRNTIPSKEYEGQKPYIYRLYISKNIDKKRFYNEIPIKSKKKITNLEKILNKGTKKNHGIIKKTKFKFDESFPKGEYFINKTLKTIRYSTCKGVVEIGMQKVYNLNTSPTNTYLVNACISGNTGGAMESGATFEAQKVFYNPEAYDCLVFNDEWENRGKIGYFVPAWRGLNQFKDTEGNTDKERALQYLDNSRKKAKKASSPKPYNDELQNRPLKPSEAFLVLEGNFFPVRDLKFRQDELISSKKLLDSSIKADITLTSDGIPKLKFVDDNKVIRDFPLQSNYDAKGCVEIFEMPKRNNNGEIPPGIYIAGTDPYDDDHSTTNSLGSTLIMNRLTDRIVAEYTGRPRTAKEFYENVRRLLVFYNARCNYENNKKGMFAYFENKNSLYLLTDTPQILKDVDMVKTFGYGNKQKGVNATAAVNSWGRELSKTWMLEQAYGKDDDIINIQTLRSVALIKEAITWNPDGNFDRISALGMLMILREDMSKIIPREDGKRVDYFGDADFFNKHYNRAKSLIY